MWVKMNDAPVVLCAVDWIGIGGDGHTAFREALARAAGTTPERVAVHCLHQHDAPRLDLSAEALLAQHGLSGKMFDVVWARDVIERASTAVREASSKPQRVTHIGLGKGKVEKVASNRRILGPDGKVKYVRWSATKDASVRDQPEGLIDPYVMSLSFFQAERPLAVLTFYTTHPQSYYRTRAADPDFPGMARSMREAALEGVPHIHFNGAGGNVTAGKYNDGSPANRPVLAKRLAEGMARAWDATVKTPVTAADLGWDVKQVVLPAAEHLQEKELEEHLANPTEATNSRVSAAKALAFLRRCQQRVPTDIACLRLAGARVLHMPGELFIEYQLAAQQMRGDLLVAMAAYGDYAPGYIGTEIAYSQGGYETSPRASRVAPHVEKVLMDAMQELLAK